MYVVTAFQRCVMLVQIFLKNLLSLLQRYHSISEYCK